MPPSLNSRKLLSYVCVQTDMIERCARSDRRHSVVPRSEPLLLTALIITGALYSHMVILLWRYER